MVAMAWRPGTWHLLALAALPYLPMLTTGGKLPRCRHVICVICDRTINEAPCWRRDQAELTERELLCRSPESMPKATMRVG